MGIRHYILLFVALGSIGLILSDGHASSFNGHDIQAEAHTLASDTQGLKPDIIALALKAYRTAEHQGHDKQHILTIIDYALPSYDKRLWVFNLADNKVLFHTWVAQGRGSGEVYATHFSNRAHTKESSIGLFATGKTYYGSDGYSLRLHGLEPGFNNHAYRRNVVMHGAWYVSKSFIHKAHRAGLSWGCPAVSKKIVKPLINTIKNDSLIFSYYPEHKWLSESKYL